MIKDWLFTDLTQTCIVKTVKRKPIRRNCNVQCVSQMSEFGSNGSYVD